MAKPNKFQLMLLGDDHEFSVAVDGIEITRCHNIDCIDLTLTLISFILLHEKFLQFDWLRTVVLQLTTLFINMRILKFKSQLTIAFSAAVDHLNGPLRKQNFSLTGLKGHGLWLLIGGFRSVLWVSVFQGSLLVIVIMIDGSEKRNCEGAFWTLEFACLWKAQ